MQLSGLPDQRELLACKQLELRSSLDERREKRKEKRRQTRRERPGEEQDVELEKDGGSCGSLALKLFYHSGAEAQRTEEPHIEKTLEVEPRRRLAEQRKRLNEENIIPRTPQKDELIGLQ